MMHFLVSSAIQSLALRGDEDLVDRLNSYYTVMILLTCTVISTAKQYMGRPIHCWVPPQFTTSMEEYIESYCWIQNTYWIPLHENIPDDIQTRENLQLGYYQWTPFILALEALMFYVPAAFWRLMNWQSGVNIQCIVNMARDTQGLDFMHRQRAIEGIVCTLEDVISLQNSLRTVPLKYCRFCPPRQLRGRYVSCIYIMVKVAYAINAIGQFFLLNTFLKGEAYSLYGLEVLIDLFRGRLWRESGHFPRVTLCDFEVKYLGNLNRYTVQCALIANLFNEKIFAFLWCWFFALSTVSLCSCFFWIANLMITTQRVGFVTKYLHIIAEKTESSSRAGSAAHQVPIFLYDSFITHHLRSDGVFMLRMIAAHAGDVMAMEITRHMLLHYRDQEVSHSCQNRSNMNDMSPDMGKGGMQYLEP